MGTILEEDISLEVGISQEGIELGDINLEGISLEEPDSLEASSSLGELDSLEVPDSQEEDSGQQEALSSLEASDTQREEHPEEDKIRQQVKLNKLAWVGLDRQTVDIVASFLGLRKRLTSRILPFLLELPS